MALIRSLSARLARARQRRREAPDIWKLYHYLYFYRQAVEEPKKYGGEIGEVGKVIPFKQPSKKLSIKKQHEQVHLAVTEQVKEKLQWLQGVGAPCGELGGDSTVGGEATAAGNPPLSPVAKDIAGYTLTLIEEHSRNEELVPGVLLTGFTPPGSVVCFFPGIVYSPEHLEEMPNYPEVTYKNPYLMARRDQSIVDAQEYTTEVIKKQPLAVGHMIRHPPLGVEPNLMPFTYDVLPSFPDHLLSTIPNRCHKTRSHIYGPVPKLFCLPFITTRSVRDEELFLNYRLHPQSETPDWYSSIDVEEDNKRWK